MADDEITAITVDGSSVPVAGVVEVDVETYAGLSYYPGDVALEFDLQQVLTYLGISDITAASQYIVNVTSNEAVENTTDGWRDPAGDAAGWGTTGGVCVKLNYPAEGYIDYIGTYDDAWEADDEYTALWGFVAGGKAAIVKVVINFVPAPVYALSDLTIEGTTECSGELYVGQTTEVECSVSASGIATALGVTEEELEDMIDSETVIFGAYNDELGLKVDSLELFSITSGCVKRACEDGGGYAGDYTDECCLTDWSYGYDYEIYDFYYDPDDATINFSIYYGSTTDLEIGDVIYTNIYILDSTDGATKAYVLKHNLTIVDIPSGGDITAMTMVNEGGEPYVITVEQYLKNDYSTTAFSMPMAEAAAALGCSVSDIAVMAAENETTLSTRSTADGGGWYLTAEGYVGSWNSGDPYYITPATEGDYSTLTIGQYTCEEGVTYTTPLYMVYGDKYFLVEVQLSIIPETPIDYDNLIDCGSFSLSVTQELDESAPWSDDYDGIDLSLLESKIGTTDPTLLGTLDTDDTEANGGVKYTETYTCTPYPGFWLTADGYVKTWSDGTYWGISTAVISSADELIFNCIQYPGLVEDGDTYKGTFYLINRETGQYVTVYLTYQIGEVINYEEVGDTTIIAPVSEDEAYVDFDLEGIAEALGVDLDELVQSDCLYAKSGNTASATLDAGLYFDADGLSVGSGDNYVAQIWFDADIEGYKLYTWGVDLAEKQTVTAVFYVQIGTSRYTVTITFMNADDYAGVSAVAADRASSSAVYDLSGRQVSKAQKGIYVTGGKKYINK
ncbi:MAG: DUF4859 domain-containing protein [Prevotellaceae bacterium]|nr:DUF4859 domain-containing protein [Prevotellaceae bacterium]